MLFFFGVYFTKNKSGNMKKQFTPEFGWWIFD